MTGTEQDRSGFSPARFTRNALIVVAIAGAALLAWDKGIKENVFPENFGTVAEERVYRSGELTPRATRDVVRRHGIRTIIDLGAHEPGSAEEQLAQRTADSLGVERMVFPLFGDGTGDPNEYVRALRIMTDPARQPVLVHCAAGAQRTGCAVALYRHVVEGAPLDTAFDEALRYRHDPEDNPEVRRMLDTWADAVAKAYREGGAVPYDGRRREREQD